MGHECELHSTDSLYGAEAGFCELGNEPSESMKSGKFLAELGDYRFLDEDNAP